MLRRKRVVVSVEQRLMQEAIGLALKRLRPCLTVALVDPATLDYAVVHRRPRLVICEHVTEIIETRVFAWVQLDGDTVGRTVISVGGRRRSEDCFHLADLLTLADEVCAADP